MELSKDETAFQRINHRDTIFTHYTYSPGITLARFRIFNYKLWSILTCLFFSPQRVWRWAVIIESESWITGEGMENILLLRNIQKTDQLLTVQCPHTIWFTLYFNLIKKRLVWPTCQVSKQLHFECHLGVFIWCRIIYLESTILFLTSRSVSVQPLLIIFVYAYKTVHGHILSPIKIDWSDCDELTTTCSFIYSISFFLPNTFLF